jgi:hypothetical protein
MRGKDIGPAYRQRRSKITSVFALVAIFLGSVGLGTSVAQASTVQVSVFSFPGLTEDNGTCADEVDNLGEIISKLGYGVDRSITSLADGATTLLSKLNASQFFFVPDMETNAFSVSSPTQFPETAVTAFQTWLDGGGVLVMTGTFGTKDVDFLKKITGYNLSSASALNSASRQDANAAGTPFADASNNITLGAPSATDAINGSAAPAEANFKAMWGTTSNASVATMSYGSGTIIFLGWDFYDAGYSGVNNFNSSPCGQTSNTWATKIVPSALEYASQLSGASALSNRTTSGGDLSSQFSQTGKHYYLVAPASATAPTAAQVVDPTTYSGETTAGNSGSDVTANASHVFSIAGLTESTDYKAYLVTVYSGTNSSVSTQSFSTLPGVPAVSSVVAGSGQVTVNIAPSGSESTFRYSINNWSSSVTRSPDSVSSPWTISGLTNGTTYTFSFRSVYKNSEGGSTTSFTVTPRPPAVFLSGLTASQGSLTPSFSSSTLTYALAVPNATASLTLTPTSAGNTIGVAGNTTVSGQESSAIALNVGANVIAVTVDSGLAGSIPTNYTITITRAALAGAGGGSAGPLTPPAVVSPPRVLPQVLPTPPPVLGPVVSATTATPPSAPTALVGGRSVVISTQVTDPNTMSLRAGVLNIGMNVSSDQGSVSSQGGSTELQVRNGGSAGLTGSGLLPRSTVQVFMPLGGSNSREIARIPVDATGSFSGDALFGATPSEVPLPIGRHVLQMVTVDENRQQTVVEMTVNIAQPPPAPELNRSTNERPALLPGQSIATNGGQPEAVTVTPIPDQKQATIQGDGWSMAVGVEGENGGVSSGEGGAVVTFVRDQGAVVSGEGFMPGTRADVWLFSDPTLLGTVDIDENGEFNGTVNIDGNVVTVGEHTLQLQGVGEDGYVRSANLGVTVADEAPALTEETSGSFLWLLLAALGVVGAAAGGTWWYRRALR